MSSSLERTLALRMIAAHPDEAAAVLEGMSDQAVVAVLGDADASAAARVLTRLAPNRAATVLASLGPPTARGLVGKLGLGEAADMLRRLEKPAFEAILGELEPGLADQLRTLVEFPTGTAGALMDTGVLALPLDVSAGDAIDRIRRAPENVRYNLYIVDRERRLVGVLNLRELLLADRKESLGALARQDVMSIEGHETAQAVLRHAAWREAHSLPVVDRRGVYLGAIRYRTWRQLLDRAAETRGRRDETTVTALGDLVSAGMGGLLGALVDAAAPTVGGPDVAE